MSRRFCGSFRLGLSKRVSPGVADDVLPVDLYAFPRANLVEFSRSRWTKDDASPLAKSSNGAKTLRATRSTGKTLSVTRETCGSTDLNEKIYNVSLTGKP